MSTLTKTLMWLSMHHCCQRYWEQQPSTTSTMSPAEINRFFAPVIGLFPPPMASRSHPYFLPVVQRPSLDRPQDDIRGRQLEALPPTQSGQPQGGQDLTIQKASHNATTAVVGDGRSRNGWKDSKPSKPFLRVFTCSTQTFILLVGLISCVRLWLHRNIPPGPSGLPLLGYAPFFGANPQDTFLKLGKRYGSIFSVYMGPKLTIVLNDYEAIKAAFIDQADIFSGRSAGFAYKHLSQGKDGHIHGLTMIEGDAWRTSRRFMIQTFRDLGMGKTRLQDHILEEVQYLTEEVSKTKGQPFDPADPLFATVANIVCILSFGQRYDYSDPTFQQMLKDLTITGDFLSQAGPMMSYPFLRFLPGSYSKLWREFQRVAERTWAFIDQPIAEHKKADGNYEEPMDYIDWFLKQQRAEKIATLSETPSGFGEDELRANLRTFFGAGTDTTTTTLQWALYFMIRYPEVQDKVHRELEEKIGYSRAITFDDRDALPFLEATIRETQRFGNVLPFGILHSNTEETTLLGYRIPKRSVILANFLAVNMDPLLWDNAVEFRPERFMNDTGAVVEPPFFMPFSIGKRACAGANLARMEVFLLFANLMQRFKFHPAGPHNKSLHLQPITYLTNISCRPLPFKVRAVPRYS